jgi:hypothetical protein
VAVKRSFYAALVVIALVEIVAPYVLHAEHGHFWFEEVPAWGSLYGLAACAAIIVVSKLLGKAALSRPENYYDR